LWVITIAQVAVLILVRGTQRTHRVVAAWKICKALAVTGSTTASLQTSRFAFLPMFQHCEERKTMSGTYRYTG
jgi:hypothetical protein